MKHCLIISLCFFFFLTARSQEVEKVIYTNENNEYRLLIDKTTKVHKQKLGKSDIETFVFTEYNQFKYSLTITRSKGINITNSNLRSPNYEQTYRNNCGCEVLSSKELKFNNISSLQFKIKRNEKGKIMLGYTESFVINNTLFNIVFIALEKDFPLYQNEYSALLNTLDINEN